jgi:hypothetical protein
MLLLYYYCLVRLPTGVHARPRGNWSRHAAPALTGRLDRAGTVMALTPRGPPATAEPRIPLRAASSQTLSYR